MAQQSITLRKTMQQCEITVDGQTYKLEPGMYVATLLSITNMEEPPKCARLKAGREAPARASVFSPERWDRGSLDLSMFEPESDDQIKAYAFSMSSFGHGIHACPGRSFAFSAFKVMCLHV